MRPVCQHFFFFWRRAHGGTDTCIVIRTRRRTVPGERRKGGEAEWGHPRRSTWRAGARSRGVAGHAQPGRLGRTLGAAHAPRKKKKKAADAARQPQLLRRPTRHCAAARARAGSVNRGGQVECSVRGDGERSVHQEKTTGRAPQGWCPFRNRRAAAAAIDGAGEAGGGGGTLRVGVLGVARRAHHHW